MKKQLLLILVLKGIVTAVAFAAPDESNGQDSDFELLKGLAYSSIHQELKLDLFLPKGASAANPVPCVIVIQGGGFNAQDGQRFRHHAEYLARHGLGAALIAYRGRPSHTYMDTVGDVKTAVRFIRKISGEYGLSSNQIGAMGSSAGATIAALLAMTAGDEKFEGDGGHPEFSSRIQSAAGISGVYDFVARFASAEQRLLQPKLVEKEKTNGEWIGAPFSHDNEHWHRASAINHIDREDPPMLLLHSKNDATVPWLQSQDMHKALTDSGVRSTLETSKVGGHGGPENAKERMVTFFRSSLARGEATTKAIILQQ